MYSVASLRIWTDKPYWTAEQRRALVALINRRYGEKLLRPAEVGNTRKRQNAYTLVFKHLADAQEAARSLPYVRAEASKLVQY